MVGARRRTEVFCYGHLNWCLFILSTRIFDSSDTPEDRLRYYASQFPLVEVDSSYYAMPKPEVAQLWTERTPQDFTFNIKAFHLFTGHQTSAFRRTA